MKHHKVVETLMQQAETERRCAVGKDKAQRSALERRAKAQELKRVFPNMYVSPTYWDSLNPAERSTHIARTLHLKHPNWIFAGITAASIHGFDHPWMMHDGTIAIVAPGKGADASTALVRRIFIPSCTPAYVDGIPVTDGARTVVDCGLMHEFRLALPVIDSALASGVAASDILAICGNSRKDCTTVFRLLHHANPASENGGESLARGTIIEGGYATPEIQQTIIDPQTGMAYRVDFMWRLADGRIIVGEFDGTRKYVDPDMSGRKTIQGVVHDERAREDALRRAKVATVVRFTFDDVLRRRPLWNKLQTAGIPKTRSLWF
ncbi:hypothetical protein [Bifidobacterium miconisargentati]|uniref:hypothetical protein n=1 Tax=Bifidobacterium miconisargentati TaxID=2834437 RepID=UPI001BDC6BFC|nr:hypothetical protein [Bifidobacterium miconisargentati]MBW3090771.1 hypothetical protein [Bifidobacterium miconisargentati]